MPGPVPQERRRRKNVDTYSNVAVTVARTGKLNGPTFATVAVLVSDQFHEQLPALRRWWDTWRRAPQSQAFLETDWQRLAMIAPLVAAYLAKPSYTAMSEIRMNETLLGATHADRLRARIKVETEPDTVTAPGVTAINDYRGRLAG